MDDRLRSLLVACGAGLSGIAVALALTLLAGLSLGTAGVSLSPLVAIGLTLVLTQGISFGGTALAYLRYRGLSLRDVGVRVPGIREVGIVVAGVVGAFVYLYAASFLLQYLGAQTAENQVVQLGIENPEVLLWLIPAAYVFIGPGEELLFRGVVQGRLRETFSAPVAIVLASVIFASIHFMALSGSASTTAKLTTIAVLLGPSLILGTTYELSENIVVPAVIHGTYDAVLFAALYAAVVTGQVSAVLPA
ncbi:MAG: lysostaphin resistance A-like protein [Halorientalis sp.]